MWVGKTSIINILSKNYDVVIEAWTFLNENNLLENNFLKKYIPKENLLEKRIY